VEIVAEEEIVVAVAEAVVLVGATPLEPVLGDRPLPSQSVKFVTNLAILLLSAGTDLRRIISLTAKVQGTCHQGMAWTQIGMWTAELLITLPESLTS
jgi:hypothetical protein